LLIIKTNYLLLNVLIVDDQDQGDWQRSITVLLQIALRTKYIDAGLLENVLLACIKSKEFGVIIKLIEELPKLTGSFVPTQFMLTQYTYAAFKLRDTERAYQSLEKMREYNHLPGSISIAEVISLLESTGETERSVDIFQTYIAEHIFPSEKEVALLVDLHGYSQVIARAAVRSALRLLLNNADAIVQRPSTPSLILITGIGKNSKENMEPILKPSIKAFLESLNPALPAKEVEDNPGRLVVSPDDVDNWIKKQKPKSAKSYNH
jgi:hypothetical protein